MYSGGFYPYKTLEEYWVYWSQYIFVNRYETLPGPCMRLCGRWWRGRTTLYSPQMWVTAFKGREFRSSAFVQDEGRYAARNRHQSVLEAHRRSRILYLELGMNPPGIVKFSLWRPTAENPNATYACVNLVEVYAQILGRYSNNRPDSFFQPEEKRCENAALCGMLPWACLSGEIRESCHNPIRIMREINRIFLYYSEKIQCFYTKSWFYCMHCKRIPGQETGVSQNQVRDTPAFLCVMTDRDPYSPR